jgi:RNA polymerase sigma-70 factor (ECF subfamily)
VNEDGELLRRWNAGDREAGEQLFERYFDPLYRFFRNKVPHACKELVQSTLLACVEKRDALRSAASFRAFLYGVARFEVLRYLRKRARSGIVVDVNETSVYDLDPSPSRVVAAKQEHRLLLEALRRIPIDLQIVVELHYWEQLATAEIAEIIGIPVGTVKSRLRRAREHIAAAVERLAHDKELAHSTIAGFDTWAAEIREACESPPEEDGE